MLKLIHDSTDVLDIHRRCARTNNAANWKTRRMKNEEALDQEELNSFEDLDPLHPHRLEK
jgi:hypothetical protein